MINSNKLLSKDEKSKIKDLISRTEKRTNAEVIIAMATESGQYDRAESLAGLFVGTATLGFSYDLGSYLSRSLWEGESLTVLVQVALMILGFIVGSLLASYIHTFRDIFVSKDEKIRSCQIMAKALMADALLKLSQPKPLLIIYISLYEKEVVILGDGVLLKELKEDFLNELKNKILVPFKLKLYFTGFKDSIELTSEFLSQKFPRTEDSKNSQNDDIRIFHPRMM